MEFEKIIKELSQNEKKVLLTLHDLNGKATPNELLEVGEFKDIVEINNASSWLKSKKLVIIEEIFKKLYSLDDEGKKFLEQELPEIRALQFISKQKGKINLNDLSKVLDSNEIQIAVGWLLRKKLANISKITSNSILEITEIGKKTLIDGDEDKKILEKLNINPNIEIAGADISNSQLNFGKALYPNHYHLVKDKISIIDFSTDGAYKQFDKFDFVYTQAVTMHIATRKVKTFL